MKRSVIIILIIFFLSPTIYSEGFKDAIPVLKEMVKSLEVFIVNMEKAEDAKGLVWALDNYSKAILKYAPAFRKIIKKYPELKDETTHPEELKPFTKKMDELVKKMMKLYGKLAKYIDDPDLKEANKRWEKAMSSLNEKEDKEKEKKE